MRFLVAGRVISSLARITPAPWALMERSTRFVLLLHWEKDCSAEAVEEFMRDAIATLPSELMHSVTWDKVHRWPIT